MKSSLINWVYVNLAFHTTVLLFRNKDINDDALYPVLSALSTFLMSCFSFLEVLVLKLCLWRIFFCSNSICFLPFFSLKTFLFSFSSSCVIFLLSIALSSSCTSFVVKILALPLFFLFVLPTFFSSCSGTARISANVSGMRLAETRGCFSWYRYGLHSFLIVDRYRHYCHYAIFVVRLSLCQIF